MALLSVEHLVKTFPLPASRKVVWAVNDVSFTVDRGETLGIVGESGSGKTTVGRCVVRLVNPGAGVVTFRGQDITQISERDLRAHRGRLQIVFQEPYDSMNPRLQIGDIIREPLRRLTSLSGRDQRARALELVEQVGLAADDLGRYPYELSAGQLQRVGIARAMATRPELIVLDEPTSLLDPSVRADIIELLMVLQEQTGVAYLFISHDLMTVRHISHRVAVMYLGKVVEVGTTDEIFERPLHPYTRALLAAVLPPTRRSTRVAYAVKGEIPSPIDLPSGCFLHSRCPMAIDACSRIAPQLVDVEGRHRVACIRIAPLPDQIVAEGQVLTAATSLDSPLLHQEGSNR